MLQFITVVLFLAGFYLSFILSMIRKILIKINNERRSLPITNIIRRLNCEDVTCQLRYFLIATFICASLTIHECILRLVLDILNIKISILFIYVLII